MKVTIRKGPPAPDTKECPVVVEVWMTVEEAKAHTHRSPALETAIEAALPEHLRTRYRVTRNVTVGRFA